MERDAIDLGTGKVRKLFRKYFIPTLLGMLGVASVAAIDGIFIGHGVGSYGIAAVNIVVTLLMLYTGLGLMLGAGCSVVASIHLSQGRKKAARINVTQAVIFGSIVALIPCIIMLIFPERTSRFLGASDELLPYVMDYLIWYVPSWVFQLWITMGLYIIRLDGSPRYAMLCSLVSAGVNVPLDWLFIFPLGWGIKGAAFATSISTVIGGLMAIIYLFFYSRNIRPHRLKMSWKSFRLGMRNIGYQCRIGLSGLLGELTIAMLVFVGNLVFIHYLGDYGVGAYGIACYYTPFIYMVGNAIAQSAQPIISYNFGLHQRHRIHETQRVALQTALLCGLIVTGLFVGFPEFFVRLFLRPDDPAVGIAIDGLPYFAVGFTFFVLNLTSVGYYQSVERILPATLFALLRGCVFLIPCFIFLPLVWGTAGMWLALPISEILTSLTIGIFYLWQHRPVHIPA